MDLEHEDKVKFKLGIYSANQRVISITPTYIREQRHVGSIPVHQSSDIMNRQQILRMKTNFAK